MHIGANADTTDSHDPGHAQTDFSEALVVIGVMERKIHFFAMDLPHSDADFVQNERPRLLAAVRNVS